MSIGVGFSTSEHDKNNDETRIIAAMKYDFVISKKNRGLHPRFWIKQSAIKKLLEIVIRKTVVSNFSIAECSLFYDWILK